MYLQDVYTALMDSLRDRVANGEISERRLARLAGLSQPHVHNALKGKKILSPSACDQILERLGLTVFDLLRFPSGQPPPFCAECPHRRLTVEVPILQGFLGPGLPLPSVVDELQSQPFRANFIASLEGACLVRLAEDPQMSPLLRENDLALLDRARHRRIHLEPNGLYVINRKGEGLIRRLRPGGGRSLVLLAAGPHSRSAREVLPLAAEHLLDVVWARVVWTGRYLLGVLR